MPCACPVCGARARAAASYRAKLSANAVKGQAAYVANWKAKNLKAMKSDFFAN